MHLAEPAPRRAATAPSRNPAALTHTLNDACRISGLSRSTLYRHATAGRLRLVKVGGRTLVDAASLRALLGVAA
jgi:excisionase family DNA binding protein